MAFVALVFCLAVFNIRLLMMLHDLNGKDNDA